MILITRPSPYGEQLTQMCLDAKLAAKHLPLFNIKSGLELTALPSQLQQLACGDLVIITSPQVIHAISTLNSTFDYPDHVRYFAVGQQTAQLFSQLSGRDVDYPKTDENSEGLLALLGEQANKKILILRGDQGRTLMRDTLSAQGCQVTMLECYRRLPIDYPVSIIDDLGDVKMIVVTSVEHLVLLDKYCTPRHKQKIGLIVSNIRTEQQASILKWQNIMLTNGANNQNLFKTISTLCHNVDYSTLHEN